ncbi:MAG: hypothetical protein AB1422_10145 [bacterium]
MKEITDLKDIFHKKRKEEIEEIKRIPPCQKLKSIIELYSVSNSLLEIKEKDKKLRLYQKEKEEKKKSFQAFINNQRTKK